MMFWLGEEIPPETLKMFGNYFSEFIEYVNYGNASGLLFLQTFDNDGRAEEATTIIDQLENDFQEAMIFGEEVAKTLLQLVMEYYHNEDLYYWLFGWLTGLLINQISFGLRQELTEWQSVSTTSTSVFSCSLSNLSLSLSRELIFHRTDGV